MNARRGTIPLLAALLAATAACDAVDRARSRFAPAEPPEVVTTGSGLALGLQTPGVLRPGEEGTLRLSITNRTDSVVHRIRLELIIPGWAEPMPPRLGDREVSMAAMEEGGTRFAYRMDEVPLEPNQSQVVEQRIRVPASGPMTEGAVPWTRTVRARLLDSDGQVLAEVESDIGVDGLTAPEPVPDTAADTIPRPLPDTAAPRDRPAPP
jgi:hypothetical protein